jgi:hypothetical protein
MAKGLRCVVFAIALAVIFSGCSSGVKSTPGVYEPVQESYAAYDATVLSGQQVDNTLKRFKETLAIVVVKGDKSYVFGDNDKVTLALGGTIHIESADQENIIDKNSSYHSYVLRDMNNEVIGIKLTERVNSKPVAERQ